MGSNPAAPTNFHTADGPRCRFRARQWWLSPTEYRAFLDRFYRLSSSAILDSNGMVDKLVGDEAIGLFLAGVSGQQHAVAAIQAARSILDGASRDDASPSGPIPVGAAVHTGAAFVGSTGAEGVVSDFTALGDVVDTTARLASHAPAGELLVSVDAIRAADADSSAHEHRTLAVRGRTEVVAMRSSTRDN